MPKQSVKQRHRLICSANSWFVADPTTNIEAAMQLDEAKAVLAAAGYAAVPMRGGGVFGVAPLTLDGLFEGEAVERGFAVYVDGLTAAEAEAALAVSKSIQPKT
jgi:hypothetical protein